MQPKGQGDAVINCMYDPSEHRWPKAFHLRAPITKTSCWSICTVKQLNSKGSCSQGVDGLILIIQRQKRKMLDHTSIFLAVVPAKGNAIEMKTVPQWVEYILVFIFIVC